MAMMRRAIAVVLAVLTVLCAALAGAAIWFAASAETVYWGSRGETVSQVQTKLKQWGYYTGSVDGVFGQSTYDAVVWVQRANGLTADGTVGGATLTALGISAQSAEGTTCRCWRTACMEKRAGNRMWARWP